MGATGWRIDPAGVESVMNDVSASVNGTASALQSVQAVLPRSRAVRATS